MMKSFGYHNFILSSESCSKYNKIRIESNLRGEEARQIYLQEFPDINKVIHAHNKDGDAQNSFHEKNTIKEHISDKEIFFAVQNNDCSKLIRVLEQLPNKVNLQDEFGWSLLMIGCQANSTEVVKELLRRGADTSVRDKAGNSAQSLIIKNKNMKLAALFFNKSTNHSINKHTKVKLEEKEDNNEFLCDICDRQIFQDRKEHLSSTVHNIKLSNHTNKCQGRYAIPETNRGYQIMLKEGWDRMSGLGPDGSGKKYPIRTVQKMDRKGLGHKIKKTEHLNAKPGDKSITLKIHEKTKHKQRKIEINFRREFY